MIARGPCIQAPFVNNLWPNCCESPVCRWCSSLTLLHISLSTWHGQDWPQTHHLKLRPVQRLTSPRSTVIFASFETKNLGSPWCLTALTLSERTVRIR